MHTSEGAALDGVWARERGDCLEVIRELLDVITVIVRRRPEAVTTEQVGLITDLRNRTTQTNKH